MPFIPTKWCARWHSPSTTKHVGRELCNTQPQTSLWRSIYTTPQMRSTTTACDRIKSLYQPSVKRIVPHCVIKWKSHRCKAALDHVTQGPHTFSSVTAHGKDISRPMANVTLPTPWTGFAGATSSCITAGVQFWRLMKQWPRSTYADKQSLQKSTPNACWSWMTML